MPNRYYPALKDFLEYRPDARWADVETEFDRTRDQLRTVLKRHERYDLISALDKNTGFKTRDDYKDRLLRIIASDEQVTWFALSHLFGGRSKTTLANMLYREGRKDLVQRIDRASRKW